MPEFTEDIDWFGTDSGSLLGFGYQALPCSGITMMIVTKRQNDALLLEPGDLRHLHGIETGGGKVAVLEIADILGDLLEAEDKKLLAGLKIAQLYHAVEA